MYEVPEWESYQRPPSKVPHQFVAFVSLKESSFSAADVIVAGAHFFGKDLVAADVVTLASRNTSSDRHTDGHEHFLGAADLTAPPSPHGNA